MKFKYKILILVISLLLLSIAIILYFNKENPEYYLRKEVTGTVTDLKIKNFSYEKVGISYNVKAELIRTNNIEFNCKDYSIYLLDKDNNLIYLVDGEKIGNFDISSDVIKISMDVYYDISSATSMKIIKKEYGYKFNKDLRDSLKKVEDNRIIYPE